MSQEIPRSFEELTPTWLTRALRDDGALGSGRVVERRIEKIGGGVGFAGQVARIRLEYEPDHESGPASLIAKLPTTNAKNRGMLELLQGYEREVLFFQQLAPKSALPTAHCYYAGMDPDPRLARRARDRERFNRLPIKLQGWLLPLATWFAGLSKRRYLVLIEDLVGARNGDQVAGCRFEEAALAVRGLAALHAGFWGDPSVATSEWLPTANLTPGAVKANFRRFRRRYFETLGHLLPPHFSEAIDWVDGHLESVLDRISGPPVTLLHGDYRLDNLFFQGDQLWAVDWQIVGRGLGTWDLAYFMTSCLSEEVDTREEQRLVELYHDALLARGVTCYGRERCQRDYTLCKTFAAYGGVAAAESIDVAGERGDELMLVSRRRFFSRVPAGPYDALLGDA